MHQKGFYALSPPPCLPSRTRARSLDAYATAASNTQADTIFIGGIHAESAIFMENQVTKLDLDFQLFADAHLCLLPHSPDPTFTQCFPLDTEGPHTLIAIWDKAANPLNQPDQLSQSALAKKQGCQQQPTQC